jgi:hypothetical protein
MTGFDRTANEIYHRLDGAESTPVRVRQLRSAIRCAVWEDLVMIAAKMVAIADHEQISRIFRVGVRGRR